MSTIKKGHRTFDGKTYSFWMFAGTKKEANDKIRDGHNHFKRFDHVAYFRVTDMIAPVWNRTPSGRRFAIWVRLSDRK